MPRSRKIGRLGENIKQLLFQDGSGSHPAAPDPAFSNDAPESGQATANPEPGVLRAVLAERKRISAGRMQFLGLGRIRAALGPLWERFAEKVWAVAEGTLRFRLASTDLFSRRGDDGFLILFATLSPEEAEIKCAMIADEIWHKLLGETGEAERLEIISRIAAIDGRRISAEPDLLAAIERQLETHGVLAAPHRPRHPRRPSSTAETSGERPGRAPAVCFLYRPVWDVRREAILMYGCVPFEAEPGIDDLSLDLAALSRTVRTLHELAKEDRRLLLLCRLHYESLARSRNRDALLQICRAIPDALRPEIVLEIAEVPVSVPQIRLADLIPPLRSFCRDIHWLAPASQTRFDNLCNAGIDAVGLDLERETQDVPRLVETVAGFAEAVRREGFPSFVHGVASVELAKAAVRAGSAQLSGPAIGPDVERVGPAYHLAPDSLLAELGVDSP